jgi:hypothetical protein
MSIFGSIVSAIFGKGQATGQAQAAADPVASAAALLTDTTPVAGGAAQPQPKTTGAAEPAPKTGVQPQSMTREQVEAMIQRVADTTGRKDYNWKQSIVDLMKLLNLDSSLAARKQLAQELGYTGAFDGSAEMNVWLHKQVMAKLMESGGVVPDRLK